MFSIVAVIFFFQEKMIISLKLSTEYLVKIWDLSQI